MIEAHGKPRSGAMAIVAIGTGGNVRERFAGLGEDATRGVADLTRAGSRLEVSTPVTFLAADELVMTRERKTGLEMIEVRGPGVFRGNRAGCKHRRDADHQECADPYRASAKQRETPLLHRRHRIGPLPTR